MPRGGKREGAGRRAGGISRTTMEQKAKVNATGLTPLDYMLSILRNTEADEAQRFAAASAAAPYCHARLTAIEHSGELKVQNAVSPELPTAAEWEREHSTAH